MTVYQEISLFAGVNPAVYVQANVMSQLALETWRTDVAQATGTVLKMALAPFAVRLDSAVGVDDGTVAQSIEPVLVTSGRKIFLECQQSILFSFSYGLFGADGPAGETIMDSILGNITIEVRALSFLLSSDAGAITIAAGDATMIPQISRAADFDAIIAQAGINPILATRIEGMLELSGIPTTIANGLKQPRSVSLSELFPGLIFNGFLDLTASADSKTLYIKASQEIVPKPALPCECSELLANPRDRGGVRKDVASINQLGTGQNPATIGLARIPLLGAIPNPGRAELGLRTRGEGEIGFYLPTDKAEDIVKGVYPAVRVDLSDNGFIGWSAAGIVDFAGVTFRADPANGAFFVTLEFRSELYGSVHADLGKLGKIRITEFDATQPGGAGTNKLTIGFYLVIGTRGLFLKPVVTELTFGDFDVHLHLFTLFGFSGWGRVAAFVADTIIAKIIAWEIPRELELAIRKYADERLFTILNVNLASSLSGLDTVFANGASMTAAYNGGAEGFLFSMTAQRG